MLVENHLIDPYLAKRRSFVSELRRIRSGFPWDVNGTENLRWVPPNRFTVPDKSLVGVLPLEDRPEPAVPLLRPLRDNCEGSFSSTPSEQYG